MQYGLAQFHLIQEKYGFIPNATFISTPDETVTRNTYRWNSGIGYGGKISWGNGNEKIIFLNVKPNLCGIFVGGLNEIIEPEEIIDRIETVKRTDLTAKKIPLNWDYQASNHFINLFKTQSFTDIKLPKYIFFIHGSSPELQDDKYGLGLYIDKSKTLRERAIKEETKFGVQYILLDNDAKEYLDFQYKALKFSKAKREIIANNLFGKDYVKISNHPHQFLRDYNNMYLGCNCTKYRNNIKNDNELYPTTLRADYPAYLFQGKRNFSEIVIEKLDFRERAEKLEIMSRLKNANVLPHGGGYNFPDIEDLERIVETKKGRFFICSLKIKNKILFYFCTRGNIFIGCEN
ncbi:MAG: hypothetical protein P8Y70_16510 [Candidatus Lokiarchaeota archaeon]